MKPTKRKKLEAAGWRVGSADDLLDLSAAESAQVNAALSLGPVTADVVKKFQAGKKITADGSSLADLRIPDGWTLEPLERLPDYALLTTASSPRYMATVDFGRRGIRSGYSTSGRFVGEEWNKRRKKYSGRGWRQQLVDDAVAHLQEVLR